MGARVAFLPDFPARYLAVSAPLFLAPVCSKRRFGFCAVRPLPETPKLPWRSNRHLSSLFWHDGAGRLRSHARVTCALTRRAAGIPIYRGTRATPRGEEGMHSLPPFLALGSWSAQLHLECVPIPCSRPDGVCASYCFRPSRLLLSCWHLQCAGYPAAGTVSTRRLPT